MIIFENNYNRRIVKYNHFNKYAFHTYLFDFYINKIIIWSLLVYRYPHNCLNWKYKPKHDMTFPSVKCKENHYSNLQYSFLLYHEAKFWAIRRDYSNWLKYLLLCYLRNIEMISIYWNIRTRMISLINFSIAHWI